MLHHEDAVDAVLSDADLAGSDHALIYQRLQDGPVFGPEAMVAAFVACGIRRVRFVGLRRLVARRPGSVPSDIVYDPDIAHVLHNFISRANAPTFYDAFDGPDCAALDALELEWPDGEDILAGSDPTLRVVSAVRVMAQGTT